MFLRNQTPLTNESPGHREHVDVSGSTVGPTSKVDREETQTRPPLLWGPKVDGSSPRCVPSLSEQNSGKYDLDLEG